MSPPDWEHPADIMRARILGTPIECCTCEYWNPSYAASWCRLYRAPPDNLLEKEGPFCPEWHQLE